MVPNSMNIIQVKGRLVSEPVLKTFDSGKKLMSFSLMYYTRQTTDKEGSHANFIEVDAWEKLAEIFHPLLKKGLEVVVNGALVQRRWKDNLEKKQSRFQITAETLMISDLNFSTKREEAA
ncbi:MAG: single-stranded DNA-binding protein [Spirochaetia bacterium]|nr:single-stranded DNA-binding protein [Spirochaetia bacterium]